MLNTSKLRNLYIPRRFIDTASSPKCRFLINEHRKTLFQVIFHNAHEVSIRVT
jgi:hypothetical protein